MKVSTEKKLLDATRSLIWSQGVNKTTVDQICNEAKVSKMTFYRAFENKFDVVKIVLDEKYENFEKNYHEIFDKNIPFVEKINEIIYFNLESVREISAELIKDIVSQENPNLKDYMDEKVNFQRELTLSYIIKEQTKGNFRSDLKIEFISFFLDHINELVFDKRLNKIYESTDELVNQLTKMFYFGVLKRR